MYCCGGIAQKYFQKLSLDVILFIKEKHTDSLFINKNCPVLKQLTYDNLMLWINLILMWYQSDLFGILGPYHKVQFGWSN